MGDPNSDDYYVRLGVARNASEADIKRAYKRAALRSARLLLHNPVPLAAVDIIFCSVRSW